MIIEDPTWTAETFAEKAAEVIKQANTKRVLVLFYPEDERPFGVMAANGDAILHLGMLQMAIFAVGEAQKHLAMIKMLSLQAQEEEDEEVESDEEVKEAIN